MTELCRPAGAPRAWGCLLVRGCNCKWRLPHVYSPRLAVSVGGVQPSTPEDVGSCGGAWWGWRPPPACYGTCTMNVDANLHWLGHSALGETGLITAGELQDNSNSDSELQNTGISSLLRPIQPVLPLIRGPVAVQRVVWLPGAAYGSRRGRMARSPLSHPHRDYAFPSVTLVPLSHNAHLKQQVHTSKRVSLTGTMFRAWGSPETGAAAKPLAKLVDFAKISYISDV
eukprot:278335-Chlamydomonas_euryale.AAC.8